jgi:hypothetical protein
MPIKMCWKNVANSHSHLWLWRQTNKNTINAVRNSSLTDLIQFKLMEQEFACCNSTQQLCMPLEASTAEAEEKRTFTILEVALGHQVKISPTFYSQLLSA